MPFARAAEAGGKHVYFQRLQATVGLGTAAVPIKLSGLISSIEPLATLKTCVLSLSFTSTFSLDGC
jgi:hypothetical protein